jgi:hypothetical protein
MIPHWRVDIMRKVLGTVEACWRPEASATIFIVW